MTPHFADGHLTVHIGDCRAVMAEMPTESVHCVVTSPPYWGLRDYGVDGQLGLEPTPEEYVANMVAVFREVRRVLRDDGTVWLNLGDSYARAQETNVPQTKQGGTPEYPIHSKAGSSDGAVGRGDRPGSRIASLGLKPKDLVGIPWRVAFALQADGWYLRSDIIWSKPNPMPESVTDRPTKAHEYVFLLSKSPRYYFDADAVREDATNGERFHGDYGKPGVLRPTSNRNGRDDADNRITGRNLRSVWTIATQPYPGAHFATFPEKLVEPCVKAGTSERGVCPECGAPWVRETRALGPDKPNAHQRSDAALDAVGSPMSRAGTHNSGLAAAKMGSRWRHEDLGWRASCRHSSLVGVDEFENVPVPATVLDPFAGSGTVGRVANRLGRRAVLIDLSADYIDQAMLRNAQAPLGLGA